MKIVFVHHYSLTYGAGGEKFIVETSNSLVKKGYDVEVRALPINRKETNCLQSLDPSVKYLEGWFHRFDADVAYYIYAPLITMFFKTDAPKVAGLHAFIYAPKAQAPKAIPRNPLLWIKRNGLQSTITHYLYRVLGKRELENFNTIHIINEAIRCTHENQVYIPLSVDTKFYRNFNERNDNFTVIFVGRHNWRKGFDTFIESAKILHKLDKNVNFICTGKGVEGLVTGLGYISDEELVELYNLSHLMVYPSRIDTFGKVITESLSCGTPLVTTPIGSHKALKLPLIYASTPKQFVDKILMVKDMWGTSEYTRLSKIGCREVLKRYSVDVVFPRFESMLGEVAKCD